MRVFDAFLIVPVRPSQAILILGCKTNDFNRHRMVRNELIAIAFVLL